MDSMFKSNAEAAAYLSAIIDGEGSVEFRPKPGTKACWVRRVRISNTSPGIIQAVEEVSAQLSIPYTKHLRPGTNRPAWEINFPGPSVELLAKVLKLADEGKRERLKAASEYKTPSRKLQAAV